MSRAQSGGAKVPTMGQGDHWRLTARQADSYERIKVPRLFAPMAVQFLTHVPLQAGDRVLDVACGTGIAARLAARRVAPGGRVAGLDLNPDMLAVASSRSVV